MAPTPEATGAPPAERSFALLDAVPDPVLVVGRAAGAAGLRVLHANPALAALAGFDPTGRPLDAALRDRLGPLLHDVDRVMHDRDARERTADLGAAGSARAISTRPAPGGDEAHVVVTVRAPTAAPAPSERGDRARRLEVLNDIGRVLAAKHSLDELYRALYREIGRVLRRDAFFVAVWDEAQSLIRFPLMYDAGVEYLYDATGADDGPTSSALREGRTIVWSGFVGRSRPSASPWGDVNRRSESAIYTPMISDGRVLGVISVQRYEGAYGDDDVRLCEAVASHAAVAVENAQLYERLRSSELQFRELIGAIERMDQHCVVVTDLNGVITHAAGTESTHGYAPADLVGRSVNRLGRHVPQAAAVTTEFISAASRGVPWTRVVMATRADGRNFPIHLSSSPYMGSTGDVAGVVTIGRDLTHEVETQQRLLQSAKLASIGELVAGVAHELNNPLTVIKSTAHLLQDDLSGAAREDVDMIAQSAERAVNIVRSLLHFARQTRPEKVEASLNDIVESALRFRREPLRSRGIAVERGLDPALPTTFVDAAQIEQVLLNLVANAEYAMAGGGTLTVTTETVGDAVRLTVQDTGAGILPEYLPRIFDPFFTTRPIGEGTGLGLALSHGIVTDHGGTIWARSEGGRGAAFVVELPVVHAVAGAVGTETAPAPSGARCSALIVDDEIGVRRSAGTYLGRHGFAVVEAASGEEALDRLAERPFDTVLLDLRMPGISGEELYALIEERWPDLAARVVFATGDVLSSETRAFLERTGNDVLEKPYSLPKLARALEAAAGSGSAAA